MAPLLRRLWRDPAAWVSAADVFTVLFALTLPWSTTLASIAVTGFLVATAPFTDYAALLKSLRRPISLLPIALFALAVVGMLWSSAPWGERFYAVGPAVKLLILPLLLYHFQRSARGIEICIAFLVSCTLLLAMSFIVALDPGLALKAGAEYGVPVKNHIDQSQEFALCAVVLAYPIVDLMRSSRILPAALLTTIALGFIANMLFIKISRTAMVTIPVMLLVFAALHLKWRSIVLITCAAAIMGVVVWTVSPQLRDTAHTFISDYRLYMAANAPTSVGLRLEFWRKSLHFISEAPYLGHGTGSIRALFQQAAIGKADASAEIVANPHNQTLDVAIQWGAIGVAMLYTMWLVHLRLFRGEGLAAWIGLMVVVQNVFTSLFNSHIFDFNEGWMYVLGVGVAGAMVLKEDHAGIARCQNAFGP